MKYLTILILTFLYTTICIAQSDADLLNGVSISRLQRYENWIRKEIQDQHISGAATLIFRDTSVVYQKALGYQNIESQRAMKMNDIFAIQSMTKPIISVAIMILYEEGYFLLSDPVSKYLPQFENIRVIQDKNEGISGSTVPLTTPITIRHLLTHTAGFASQGPSLLEKQITSEINNKSYDNIEDRVSTMMQFPLIAQPGEAFIYGPSTDVLSVLIEYFSGMTTRDFLRKRIFEPLQMTDTDYNMPLEASTRFVPLHEIIDGSLTVSSEQDPTSGNTVYRGVNGLFSTVSDYLHFSQMLLNKGYWRGLQILGPKTIELMLANHTDDLFPILPGHYFGLGFAVTEDVGISQVTGTKGLYLWAGLYNTYFFIDPREKLIAIFMTQSWPFSLYYLQKMKQLVYQSLIISYSEK